MRVKQHRLTLAFSLSLLLHMLGVLLVGVLVGVTLRSLRVVPRPQPTESIVMLSDAITIGKRAHPVREAPARPRAHRPTLAPKRVPLPASAIPAHAALAPRAEVPRAHPRVQAPLLPHLPHIASEHELALAPVKPALSQTQIERLDQDFARTIAREHATHDPLNVPTAPPAAPKRYRLQFQGIFSDLHGGQGILTPIRSWSEGGYTYYYLTYGFVWDDGTYESGAVPWPVRYRPDEDPFAEGRESERIPLPPPLPGWRLPPNIHLGKVLQAYFPSSPSAK